MMKGTRIVFWPSCTFAAPHFLALTCHQVRMIEPKHWNDWCPSSIQQWSYHQLPPAVAVAFIAPGTPSRLGRFASDLCRSWSGAPAVRSRCPEGSGSSAAMVQVVLSEPFWNGPCRIHEWASWLVEVYESILDHRMDHPQQQAHPVSL